VTKKTDNNDEPVVRPFADWLREQGKGETHDELSVALNKLVTTVHETGKKGQLAFTVTIQPMKKNPDVLEVTDSVVLKLPTRDRKASIFYPDADGNLTRKDPHQLEFEGLREVPGPVDADQQPTTSKEKQA
jgi:hypothetical protein